MIPTPKEKQQQQQQRSKHGAAVHSSQKPWNMNKVDDNVSNKSDLWHLKSEFCLLMKNVNSQNVC